MFKEIITDNADFQKVFNAKEKKEVTRALSIVEDFLPKDSSSPWPKEPRKMYSGRYDSTTLLAFDGTMGVSASFGPRMKRFLTPFKKCLGGLLPSQQKVFERMSVGSGNFLPEPVELDTEDLKELLFRYGYRIWYHIKFGDTFYNLSGQDILRLIATAKKCGYKTIRLFQVHDIEDFSSSYQMLTFEVGKGICVHILSTPEFHVED